MKCIHIKKWLYLSLTFSQHTERRIVLPWGPTGRGSRTFQSRSASQSWRRWPCRRGRRPRGTWGRTRRRWRDRSASRRGTLPRGGGQLSTVWSFLARRVDRIFLFLSCLCRYWQVKSNLTDRVYQTNNQGRHSKVWLTYYLTHSVLQGQFGHQINYFNEKFDEFSIFQSVV